MPVRWTNQRIAASLHPLTPASISQESPSMTIAYIRSLQRGGTNELFDLFARRLLAQGCRVVGTIQTNSPRPKSHKCNMDVRLLPGPLAGT